MFKKAIMYFACTNVPYIMLRPFLVTACEKYGAFSWQHWLVSLVIWFICVMIIYAILKMEDSVKNEIEKDYE